MIGRKEFGFRWLVVGWMAASWFSAMGAVPSAPAWVYGAVAFWLALTTLAREAVRGEAA